MKAVLTNCPHCLTRQLVDEKSIGTHVVCVACQTIFTCEADSEPLQWARSAVNKDEGASFEKNVSRILFSYGVAVPVEKQDMIIDHVGTRMSFGSTVCVTMEVGDKGYQVELSLFTNKKGEPALHFKWQKNPQMTRALTAIFPEAYEHFIVKGQKGFLQKTVVEIGPAKNEGVFWLKCKAGNIGTIARGGKRKGGRSREKNLDEVNLTGLLERLEA